MIQSNDILFNEPALHSLKRAQLFALCKRYNIKQTGKNEELIARLRKHAKTLLDQEPDAMSSEKESNENVQDDPSQQPQVGEQWELVEVDSQEDVSMTLDKRSSLALALSMKSMMSMAIVKSHASRDINMDSVSSRTSSLKSIAKSLKRVGSRGSKLSVSSTDSFVRKPISQLFPQVPTKKITPAPGRVNAKSPEEGIAQQTDPVAPIIEGTVDANALDKNQSTIRLVTPPPRSPTDESRIKATPKLRPLSVIFPEPSPNDEANEPAPKVTVSQYRTPEKAAAPVVQEERLLGVSPAPFIFGSPAHAVSNLQFNNAANAILEEMNKRLGLDSTSSGAAKISADGTLNFGEVTPSSKAPLATAIKQEGRFSRAHEREFEKMDSIATHYSMKRAASPIKPGPLAGTKRKSMHMAEGARVNGTKTICLNDPKDRTTALPPAKRQKVNGAELVKKDNDTSSANKTMVKDDTKAQPERRRSLKGRTNLGVSTSQNRSAIDVKAAPTSRFEMIKTGAAKAVKNLVSSVVNGPSTATASKPTTARKATVPPATTRAPAVPKKDVGVTVQRAPSRQTPSRMSTSSTRSSTIATRASATRVETKPNNTTRATDPVLPIKDIRRPTLSRVATAGLQRAGLPSFQLPGGSPRASASKKTDAEPAKANVSARQNATAKPSKDTSKARTDAVKAKAEPIVADEEERPSRSVSRRNPDFEPGVSDGERSRSCSPLPAPPASLSSRPLNRRVTNPTDPDSPQTAEGVKGSLNGRKPRISRSKVIAKVHEKRQVPKKITATPLKSRIASNMAKARKSGNLTVKAKIVGPDGARARASAVAASAETAMRKARVSHTARVRRRTMAKV